MATSKTHRFYGWHTQKEGDYMNDFCGCTCMFVCADALVCAGA